MIFSPVDPDALPSKLADWLVTTDGIVRVAIDGPPCSGPDRLAESLAGPLPALGRPFAHVRAESFWRDASLRFEHGREDVESYLSWVDDGALHREVLTGSTYLPSLRDPVTNRAIRAEPQRLAPGTVLVVSGALLLGLGLPFDRVVHLAVSSGARKRRTPPEQAWTLPAFDRYDAEVDPPALADVVIRLDDPRHPAAHGL